MKMISAQPWFTGKEKLLIPENTASLVIDVQKGLDDPRMGVRNNPGAEAKIALLLDCFRAWSCPCCLRAKIFFKLELL